MSHARVEEVSDSDADDAMDPDEMDIEEVERELMSFDEKHPAAALASSSSASASRDIAAPPPPQARQQPAGPTKEQLEDRKRKREAIKKWQCLYPIYFDAGKTREQGRRVSKELAVENPLAREIWEAAGNLGFQVAFEPENTHPKDWANPGRVRVALKEPSSTSVKNKHHLYIKIAEYLKEHPTTEDSPLRLRLPGMPMDVKPPAPPAVPRGWKMNEILPFHSCAVSGGGVSENLFKDMMAMQGNPGGAAPPAVEQSGGNKKKDKKKAKP